MDFPQLLRDNNISWVQNDEPKFRSSVAAEVPLTSDMGYFRWTLKSKQGIAIIAADLFAIALSVYVGVWLGWANFGKVFVTK